MQFITSKMKEISIIRLAFSLSMIMMSCFFTFETQAIYAAQFESFNRVQEISKAFLTGNIKVGPNETLDIKINQTDAPLQVHACAKEISVALPANTNQEQITAVEVSCNDSQPWHIFLPVDVQVFTNVVVAKQTIPSKEMITEDDLELASFNKNRLYSGYFTSKNDVIGNQASHLITSGTVLTKKNVQQPVIVRRNQAISLTSQYNSVIVTMQGIAKEDGALNSSIKVFNPSSKKMLEAIVTGPSKAQIVS